MKVLFGTKNKSKIERLQNLLSVLNLQVLSLSDVNIIGAVDEDGSTAEENAIKKAKSYYKMSGIPTFSIDYALRVDNFPEEIQPNTHVRRLWKDDREATDDELLCWFIDQLLKFGGRSDGTWYTAVALCLSHKKLFSTTFTTRTLFLSIPSKIHMSGEPLNSIQFDMKQNKYKSERTPEEWVESSNATNDQMLEFFRRNLLG